MRMAYRGECTGLIFAFQHGDRHSFGTVGTYKQDKALAKEMSGEMHAMYRDAKQGARFTQLHLVQTTKPSGASTPNGFHTKHTLSGV